MFEFNVTFFVSPKFIFIVLGREASNIFALVLLDLFSLFFGLLSLKQNDTVQE